MLKLSVDEKKVLEHAKKNCNTRYADLAIINAAIDLDIDINPEHIGRLSAILMLEGKQVNI